MQSEFVELLDKQLIRMSLTSIKETKIRARNIFSNYIMINQYNYTSTSYSLLHLSFLIYGLLTQTVRAGRLKL